jgi:hypothetical protein
MQRHHLAAGVTHLVKNGLAGARRDIRTDHAGTLAGKQQRARAPDSTATSRDDANLSLQPACHVHSPPAI